MACCCSCIRSCSTRSRSASCSCPLRMLRLTWSMAWRRPWSLATSFSFFECRASAFASNSWISRSRASSWDCRVNSIPCLRSDSCVSKSFKLPKDVSSCAVRVSNCLASPKRCRMASSSFMCDSLSREMSSACCRSTWIRSMDVASSTSRTLREASSFADAASSSNWEIFRVACSSSSCRRRTLPLSASLSASAAINSLLTLSERLPTPPLLRPPKPSASRGSGDDAWRAAGDRTPADRGEANVADERRPAVGDLASESRWRKEGAAASTFLSAWGRGGRLLPGDPSDFKRGA
mmetsp:Transcript_21653/g.63032  ORF Transcript_21653/g.63032 Transcript_21653/m.63032 type:complete len:293 (+) Transcript_21653:1101-1979(+)